MATSSISSSSNTSSSGAWTFVHIDNVGSDDNRVLLSRFYNELMKPNFPDPDELDVTYPPNK
jgi:hypothetical protein